MTATTGSLLKALLAVQAQAPTLPKDGKNPAFGGSRFTTLKAVVDTVGPLLAENGLVWMSKPGTNEHGQPVLHYTLAHAPSGEREEGSMPLLLTKTDSQGQGSAITYARRYSLCAVLNLVADDDDDGNAAGRHRTQEAPRSNAPSAEQMTELAHRMQDDRPPSGTLHEMLTKVGASVPITQVEDGSWAHEITREQAGGLLALFRAGDGESDVPVDDEAPGA